MVLLAKGCGASSGFETWPCYCRLEKGKGPSRARGGKKSMAYEYPVYIIEPEKLATTTCPFRSGNALLAKWELKGWNRVTVVIGGIINGSSTRLRCPSQVQKKQGLSIIVAVNVWIHMLEKSGR
jgi:hypothetical protein